MLKNLTLKLFQIPGEHTDHWDPNVRSAYETMRLIAELEQSGSKTVAWLKSIARLVGCAFGDRAIFFVTA